MHDPLVDDPCSELLLLGQAAHFVADWYVPAGQMLQLAPSPAKPALHAQMTRSSDAVHLPDLVAFALHLLQLEQADPATLRSP